MAAYLIVEHIITDAAKFEEYRTKVGPLIAKYGGRYLTKGGTHKMPEGGHWKPERVVIIEFPDMTISICRSRKPPASAIRPSRSRTATTLFCAIFRCWRAGTSPFWQRASTT